MTLNCFDYLAIIFFAIYKIFSFNGKLNSNS